MNFQVRYEIIGRGKSKKYFQIDSDTGVLRVISDLKKEVDTEYQVSKNRILFKLEHTFIYDSSVLTV